MGSPVSLGTVISKYVRYRPVSIGMLTQKLGMTPPSSIRTMSVELNGIPSTMSFSQPWVTPAGTPLGGTVTLNLNSDGTYTVEFITKMNSCLASYDFQLRAYLRAPGLPHCLFFYHAGNISPNYKTGSSENDLNESGSNLLIAMYWNQIVSSASFSVAKDYKWSGPVGLAEDLLNDLIDIGAGAAGAAIGVVIALTKEAIGWLGTTLGPGGTFGVVAGVVVFAVGAIAGLGVGSALILGTVAGVAAGAVANSMIQTGPMSPQEIELAQKVFGSELPYENVRLTNLCTLNGRSFTALGVDGKTYCSLGTAYNNPLAAANGAYPVAGELMIHELTHAWQIAHNSFVPGFVCSGVVNGVNYVLGDNVYAYGPAGPDWSSFNLEQQGQIVNQWFGGKDDQPSRQEQWAGMSRANPYYRYISGNILTGSAGFSTSWL